MSKFTYNAIHNAPDQEIKQLYLELKEGTLPKGCKVRVMQSALYSENGKTVPLSSVMYRVAMEAMSRFGSVG